MGGITTLRNAKAFVAIFSRKGYRKSNGVFARESASVAVIVCANGAARAI
ncbi:MAG: hypothetical protein IMW89_06570 [Ktedonobacteraceae bacterium]|nr:hypothetical protein [Ktedonobacteraceae bacterium]